MIELYNALKFITMLFFIQKILTFNLGVVFLNAVSIVGTHSVNPSFAMVHYWYTEHGSYWYTEPGAILVY